MKFLRALILYTLIFICKFDHIASFSIERRQSMMEYINNLFSEESDNIQIKKNKKSSKIQSAKQFRFKSKSKHKKMKQAPEEPTETPPPAPAPAPAPAPDPAPSADAPKANSADPSSNNGGANDSNNNGKPTNGTDTNSSLIGNYPDTVGRSYTPDPLMGEWFMISSPAFKDPLKFPQIVLKDNSRIIIQTDLNGFRINNATDNPLLEDKLPSNKFFWFRLSGLNIYYSTTKTDVNILGAISIDSLSSIVSTGTDATTEYVTTCFTVNDLTHTKWKICGLDEVVVKKWYCQIKLFLKEEDLIMCPVVDPTTTVIERTVNITQPIIIIPLPAKQCNQNWNYQNDGEDWQCDCIEGKEQAPIDLPDPKEAIPSDVCPLFQYERIESKTVKSSIDGFVREGKLEIQLKENLLRIFHNKIGTIVTVDGAVYYAEEIVFHTPAEHTLQGKKYDMEIQIIHYGQTKGDIAKQVVLCFLFENTPGKYNQFLEDLDIFDLPNPINPVKDLKGTLFVPNILKTSEEENDMISMEPFSFFTYQGSLTMPPCTENTIMYVASDPLPIGSTALQLLKEALRIPDMMDQKGNIIASDWVPKSSRKIQEINGRPVFHTFHEKQNKEQKQVSGHYEKIKKSITSYFYVDGNSPSGIPNAYVVSDGEAHGRGAIPHPK